MIDRATTNGTFYFFESVENNNVKIFINAIDVLNKPACADKI